jgi:hypothetical protein
MTDNTPLEENTNTHQIIELDDKEDKNIPDIVGQISPTCEQNNEFIDLSFDIRNDILEYTLDID